MGRFTGGRRIGPAVGALVTALLAAMAFAPAALASPQARVNFFKYNTADATHHALIFNATNTGSYGYDTFDIELTQTTKISNVVLYVGKTAYKTICVAENGGWPVVQCTPPTTLMRLPGSSWNFGDDPLGLTVTR